MISQHTVHAVPNRTPPSGEERMQHILPGSSTVQIRDLRALEPDAGQSAPAVASTAQLGGCLDSLTWLELPEPLAAVAADNLDVPYQTSGASGSGGAK